MQIRGRISTCATAIVVAWGSLALGAMALAGDPTGDRVAGTPRQSSAFPSRVGKKAVPKSRPIRQASGTADPVDGPERSKSSGDQSSAPDDTARAEARSTPIDLSTALRLAGVQNLELVIARQRVEESVALQQLAAAQILPTLNGGTNYDAHTGVLQQASGNILNVQRSALYVGAGANAVAAGSVPIPGLQYNLNVAESIYTYLVNQQRTDQSRFASRAAENNVLLTVARAYTDLLRAEGLQSVAVLTRNDAREVARLTANYARTGEGREADADRAATELARREADLSEAHARLGQASHRLCELLNLDVTLPLRTVETQVVPQPVVPNRIPLGELLAIALLQRPELQARQAAIRAALFELDSAKVLPFSPTMIAGFSGGVFGGGSNLVASSTPPVVGLPPNQPRFGDFKARTDVDVVFYWSLRNLGLGNKALIDGARARARGANLEHLATLDRVRQEVADACVRTHARYAEIEKHARGVRSGAAALKEDLIRVKGREGLPIEVLDSVRQLARSRQDYLNAIIEYNQAQFDLYVALGQPPADTLARPVEPAEEE